MLDPRAAVALSWSAAGLQGQAASRVCSPKLQLGAGKEDLDKQPDRQKQHRRSQEVVSILGIPRGGEYLNILGFGGEIAEFLHLWCLSTVAVTSREQE